MSIEMSDLNFYLDSSVTDLCSGSLSVNVSVWSILSSYCCINLESFKFHFLSVCPQFVLSTESLHYLTGILEL